MLEKSSFRYIFEVDKRKSSKKHNNKKLEQEPFKETLKQHDNIRQSNRRCVDEK